MSLFTVIKKRFVTKFIKLKTLNYNVRRKIMKKLSIISLGALRDPVALRVKSDAKVHYSKLTITYRNFMQCWHVEKFKMATKFDMVAKTLPKSIFQKIFIKYFFIFFLSFWFMPDSGKI